MGLIFEILQGVVVMLIAALIDVPLLRFGARILALKRFSFGATYLLALIVSGSLIIFHSIVSPALSGISFFLQAFITVVLSLAVSGWGIGYFVTTEDRKSIGWAEGTKLVLVVNLLFAIVAVLLVVIFGKLFSAVP
jgi:hypothetical protein